MCFGNRVYVNMHLTAVHKGFGYTYMISKHYLHDSDDSDKLINLYYFSVRAGWQQLLPVPARRLVVCGCALGVVCSGSVVSFGFVVVWHLFRSLCDICSVRCVTLVRSVRCVSSVSSC